MKKFQSSLYEGPELDNHNDIAFSIHKLRLLSGGGGVSSQHRKDVLTAHNWWSVEYETAAVLLNSIKEKVKVLEVEGCRSLVVRALWLKPAALGSIPGNNQDISLFSFAFFQVRKFQSNYGIIVANL